MIDFEQIPDWWALCGNSQCEHAGECLRHKAFMEAPKTVTRWSCVLPTAIEDGECCYFQKAEEVRMARGFKKLMEMKNKYARHEIRMKLLEHFRSKGTYYRYRDGERWLNPELQQMIANLMQEQGVKEQPVFDEYKMTYDFTKITS